MGGGLNSPSQVGQCGIPVIEDVSAVRGWGCEGWGCEGVGLEGVGL